MWYVKLNYKANYTKQRLSSNKLWYSRQPSSNNIRYSRLTLDIRHHNETGFIGWDWYPIYSLNALPEVSGYELYRLRQLRCMLRLRYNCVALMAKQTSRIVASQLPYMLYALASLRICLFVFYFSKNWLANLRISVGYPHNCLAICCDTRQTCMICWYIKWRLLALLR